MLHLGYVGLFAFAGDVSRCEIGYWLRPSQTWRRHMTEAAQSHVQHAVERFNMERI